MKTPFSSRAGRTAFGFGLLISALLLASPANAATSAASPNGIIKGKVLFNKKPVAGISVTLLGVPNTGDNVASSSTTDPSGTFSFTKLQTGTNWNYSVSARYKGALFSTDQVALKNGESRQVNVAVFEPTTSTSKITLTAYAIWIDYTGKKVAVQQDLQLHNTGTTAYVGTNTVTLQGTQTPAAVQLPLAPGADTLQYLGRFGTCCSVTSGNEWWHTRPISPGTSQGTMRYEASIPKSLAFPMPFSTTAVAVLVPKNVSVSIPGLKYVGTKSDTGTSYAVYQGGPMASGSVLTVELGKPPRSVATVIWIVVPIALIIIIGLVLWLVVRQRRASKAAAEALAAAAAAKPKGKKKAPKPPKAAKVDEPAAPTTPAQTVLTTTPAAPAQAISIESWSELADKLARLDLAYESGALTDETTYRTLREGLVAKLVATSPPE
jgi:hypothetical protein